MQSTLFNSLRRFTVWAGGALLAVGFAAWPLWSQVPAPPKIPAEPNVPDVKPGNPDLPDAPNVPAVDPNVPEVPKTPDARKAPDVKPGDVPAIDPKLPRDPNVPNVDPKLPRDPNANRDPNDRRDPNDTRAGADVRGGLRAGAHADFNPANVRSADIGLWFNRNAQNGLVINSVNTTGAIASLGFRDGDRIVSVNGQRIVREADFVNYLFATNIRTQRVPVIVVRGGAQQTIYVQPTTLVEDYTTTYSQTDPVEEFGIVVDDRYADQIVVWRVIPRSPAYYAGIRAGDVLVSFHNQKLTSARQLTTVVQGLDTGVIPVQVMRNRQARTLEVDFTARAGRRTSLRPNVDAKDNLNDVERANPRREDRIEDRQDRREDVREGRAPDNDSAAPTAAPALEGGTRQPTYSQPQTQPRRRGFFSRGR